MEKEIKVRNEETKSKRKPGRPKKSESVKKDKLITELLDTPAKKTPSEEWIGTSHFKKPEIDKDDKKEEEKILTPAEYFENIKGKITEETSENLKALYDVTMKQLKKFMTTGQKSAAKELYARCIYLEKEAKLIDAGVTKYVNRVEIDNFIDNVADECVVITEMRNYDRPIPDEIVDKVAEVMELFDEFYIVFTDYTGEKRSKVEKERREKDPILFGNIFIDGRVSPKMYFIGDWIDDHCDLTLDAMISKIAEETMKTEDQILYDIRNESTLDDIETALFGTSKRVSARTIAGDDK